MKNKICSEYKTIGYWYEFGGVELKHIDFGIEDYAYVSSQIMTNMPKNHKCKVYTGAKGAYIVLHGRRLYFSACIRVADQD